VTWTPNLLSGSNYQFDWILEDEKEILDKKTTYLNIYRPIDGYFTINGEVVTNSTLKVSKPNIEFWFYSKSRGNEISSVFVEISDANGLLSDLNIILSKIDPNRGWYGNYTLQEEGKFKVKGSFQSVQEEWVKMSAGLIYSSELSQVQIQFLNNGIVIISILVLGYSIFYLGKRLIKSK